MMFEKEKLLLLRYKNNTKKIPKESRKYEVKDEGSNIRVGRLLDKRMDVAELQDPYNHRIFNISILQKDTSIF